MMRTPPPPISHNFYHPAPQNNVYDYQCMLPQDQLSEWKRNHQQQQQRVSQPTQTQNFYPTVSSSSSSYLPAHSAVYSDSAYTTAPPTISLQQPATPDMTPITASRRSTPTSSPQMPGGLDWALYPEASYRPPFSAAPREGGLKVETYLAPFQSEHVSMAIPPQSRIRNLRPESYEELPPLSAASSRRSVSESGTYSPLTPSTSPNPEADRASGINLPNSLSTHDSHYSSDMYARGPRHHTQQASYSDVPELYNRAQNQHSEDRIHSAFKSSSPFHRPASRSPAKQLLVPLNYASHQRERRAEEDAQHAVRTNDRIQSTPKTISPKDAYLEYHAPEDEAGKVSLFGREETIPAENSMANHGIHQSDEHSTGYNDFIGGFDASKIDFSQPLDPYHEPVVTGVPEYDYHGMNHHQAQSTTSPTMRTGSLSGPYPCSAPGCIQRFQTPAKLQKHRREFHRQITPQASSHGGMTTAAHIPKSHQPGPHQCLRINPTTGKPCNTIFSRPYDLTRHEDTIHNTNREKARCEICNDEKTFSRQDALTRHKKVKHGIDK